MKLGQDDSSTQGESYNKTIFVNFPKSKEVLNHTTTHFSGGTVSTGYIGTNLISYRLQQVVCNDILKGPSGCGCLFLAE